ncbi:MAG: hypothetical protein ACD_45C00416G0002 [uncultured bacterium]|nr:MAG: hypothetical protein ACD_45C00416G0002 [uncultured bacterium]
MQSRLETLLTSQFIDPDKKAKYTAYAKDKVSHGLYNRILDNLSLIDDDLLSKEMECIANDLQKSVLEKNASLQNQDCNESEEQLMMCLKRSIETEELDHRVQLFLDKIINRGCQSLLDGSGNLCKWFVVLFQLEKETNNPEVIKQIISSYCVTAFQQIKYQLVEKNKEDWVFFRTMDALTITLNEKFNLNPDLVKNNIAKYHCHFKMSVDCIVQQYVAARFTQEKAFSLSQCPSIEMDILNRLLDVAMGKGDYDYAAVLNDCYADIGVRDQNSILMRILSPYKKAFSQHLLENERYVVDTTEAKSDNSSSNDVSPSQSRASSSVSVVKNSSLFSRSNSWSFLDSQGSQEEWVVVDDENEPGSQVQSSP